MTVIKPVGHQQAVSLLHMSLPFLKSEDQSIDVTRSERNEESVQFRGHQRLKVWRLWWSAWCSYESVTFDRNHSKAVDGRSELFHKVNNSTLKS